MNTQTDIQTADNEYRKVHPISKSEAFFNEVQLVLHMAAGDVFFHDVPFTILLNIINRNSEETKQYKRNELEKVPLIYGGLEVQRNLLQVSFNQRSENEAAWQVLEKTLNPDADYMKMLQVSSEYYGKIAKGGLELKDIKVGRLADYFAENMNPIKEAEKIIFEQQYLDPADNTWKPCFDIEKDLYLSIPVIGFAEFDGLAHIIFQEKGQEWIKIHTISLIIKRFQREYENVFFSWATVDEQREKHNSIRRLFTKEISNDDYYNNINTNDILKEIGCLDRYKKYAQHYNFRLNEADSIPNLLYLQYLRQAITAILIDSYAHNISAHSLTALSWWFRLRSMFRDKVKKAERSELDELWDSVYKILEHGSSLNESALEDLLSDLDAIRTCRTRIEAKYAQEAGSDGNSLITHSGHLSRELYPFFKFLMEKGAYWSGITRDANIGGKINSFFSILWYDFINNPLFLGTIAKMEDIKGIKINITIYEPNPNSDPASLIQTHTIQEEGILACIDLDNPRNEPADSEESDGTLAQRSIFVEPGQSFASLQEKLDRIKVYFPGGMVGKHAFFTMLENEIRNVKHYHGKDVEILQKEGLVLNISVQPCSLPRSNRQELYRIGIWLKTPTVLQKSNDRHLVVKKWETLYNEITEPVSHSPKLGGTYQDKVCAAMLMNSRFSSVQDGFKSEHRDSDKDSERDKMFFPWVTPACSALEDKNGAHKDFGLTSRNIEQFIAAQKEIPAEFSGAGYLKKYFNLWRFEDALNLEQGSISKDENCSRFRFVFAPGDKLFSLRKDNGVVRIITQNQSSDKVEEVYRQWLEAWNDGFPPMLFLEENGKPHTLFALDDGKFKIYYADDFDRQNPDALRLKAIAINEDNIQQCVLNFAHKEGSSQIITNPDILRYRNHGSMRTHFWASIKEGNPFRNVAEQYPDRLLEFYETMITRVCIFDNRIWQRVRKEMEEVKGNKEDYNQRLDFYRDKLKLIIYGESPTDTKDGKNWLQEWEGELHNFVPTCHFLVLHLSLIERILETKYLGHADYKPGNIGLFIKEELLPVIEKDGHIRDNFFLVITTSRGRSEWLGSLEDEKYREYNRFTIFRPVESLISAVDYSLSINDDIDLKFRLAKVLFGS